MASPLIVDAPADIGPILETVPLSSPCGVTLVSIQAVDSCGQWSPHQRRVEDAREVAVAPARHAVTLWHERCLIQSVAEPIEPIEPAEPRGEGSNLALPGCVPQLILSVGSRDRCGCCSPSRSSFLDCSLLAIAIPLGIRAGRVFGRQDSGARSG